MLAILVQASDAVVMPGGRLRAKPWRREPRIHAASLRPAARRRRTTDPESSNRHRRRDGNVTEWMLGSTLPGTSATYLTNQAVPLRTGEYCSPRRRPWVGAALPQLAPRPRPTAELSSRPTPFR